LNGDEIAMTRTSGAGSARSVTVKFVLKRD
jgi:hypothetical protein